MARINPKLRFTKRSSITGNTTIFRAYAIEGEEAFLLASVRKVRLPDATSVIDGLQFYITEAAPVTPNDVPLTLGSVNQHKELSSFLQVLGDPESVELIDSGRATYLYHTYYSLISHYSQRFDINELFTLLCPVRKSLPSLTDGEDVIESISPDHDTIINNYYESNSWLSEMVTCDDPRVTFMSNLINDINLDPDSEMMLGL